MRRKQQEMQHLRNFNIQRGQGTGAEALLWEWCWELWAAHPVLPSCCPDWDLCVAGRDFSEDNTFFSQTKMHYLQTKTNSRIFFFFPTQETRLQLSKIQHSAKKSDLLTFYYLASWRIFAHLNYISRLRQQVALQLVRALWKGKGTVQSIV